MGLTQADLARALGISTAAMSHIATGKTKGVRGGTLAALERVTGYNAQWIAEGRGPKQTPGRGLDQDQVGFIVEGFSHLSKQHQDQIAKQIQFLLTLDQTEKAD